MTIGEAFYLLKSKLAILYPQSEATAMAHEVLENITQLSKIDRLMEKEQIFSSVQQNELDYILDELLQGKPLQYVLGKCSFMGKDFFVNNNVLIPRPETEELVIWILNDYALNIDPKCILDIGTGSGCIPISLKAEMRDAIISGCDVSRSALEVAKRNAENLLQKVIFFELNILDKSLWVSLPEYDIIVSNPPYIPLNEFPDMDQNVKDHEPHLALFVADNDRFIFYRAIAQLGKTKLKKYGAIYCEIHRDFAEETKSIFETEGYKNIELRKDMHDNWRMIKAQF